MRRLCARCSWSPPLRNDTRPWRSQASTSPTIMRSGYSSTTRRMPRRRSWMLRQLSWWRSAAPAVGAQERVLGDLDDRVEAEAVDVALEPEAQHVVHRRLDLRVVPVEVGLLGHERVQVPLLGALVEAPRRADRLERRDPVVGRTGPPGRRRAIRTSRASDRHARSATPRTTGGGPTCGSEPSRAPRGCRARGTRPRAGRGPRACRTAGRRRGSRRRRSRSRPSAT